MPDGTHPEIDPTIFAPTHPDQPAAAGVGQGEMKAAPAAVDLLLNQVQEVADALHPQLDRLIGSLECVMSPQAPAEDAPNRREEEPGNSDFAARLKVARAALCLLQQKIADAAHRLEI